MAWLQFANGLKYLNTQTSAFLQVINAFAVPGTHAGNLIKVPVLQRVFSNEYFFLI